MEAQNEMEERGQNPGKVGIEHMPGRAALLLRFRSPVVGRGRKPFHGAFQQLEVMTKHPAIKAPANLQQIKVRLKSAYQLPQA